MELKIGSTIQSLRKQKNMTQEMLASALGVSAAAVSKWETDVTYPDISLLSPLARMLGTDVDEILNYHVELNDEEIESFTKKARVYYEQGQVQEGIDFCEAALREYPTDLRLKFQIASLYMTYATAVLDEEYAKGRLKRAIELYEAARASDDREISESALYVLSGLYMMDEDVEKALAAVDQLPCPDYDARMMKASILLRKGEIDEAVEIEQRCLWKNLRDSELSMFSLSQAEKKRGNLEKALEITDLVIQLDKMMHLDQADYMISSYELQKAEIFCQLQRQEEAYDCLERFVQGYERFRGGKREAYPLLFDKIKWGEQGMSEEFLLRNARMMLEQDEELESLKQEERFLGLLKRLGQQQ